MSSQTDQTNRMYELFAPDVHSWEGDFEEHSICPQLKGAFGVGFEPTYSDAFVIAEKLHYFKGLNRSFEAIEWDDWVAHPFDHHTAVIRRGDTTKSTENLRHRLANTNDYFRRKASEVFNDQAALDLLKALYQDVVVDITAFDVCESGLPLARLTAANFCEVGAKVIYITEAGQRFIDTLRAHE